LPTDTSTAPEDLKRPHDGAIIVIVTRYMPEDNENAFGELVQPSSRTRRLTVVLAAVK
jgi:hypothetical protein